MDKRYAKVLLVLRNTTLEALGLKRGQGYEDRHFVKKDKDGKPVFESRVRVECEVTEDSVVKDRPNEDLYEISHDIVPPGNHFYEVQLTEGSAPNTATIIAGLRGEKLEPRKSPWMHPSIGMFSTVKGAFLAIEYGDVLKIGNIFRYSLIPEGSTFYLRKESVGMFVVSGVEIEGDKERPLIKWSKTPFAELEGEEALRADDNLTAAIQAAIVRSNHNCFHPKRGCEYPHYAFTVEEIKLRRQEARVRRETEQKEKEAARRRWEEEARAKRAVSTAIKAMEDEGQLPSTPEEAPVVGAEEASAPSPDDVRGEKPKRARKKGTKATKA